MSTALVSIAAACTPSTSPPPAEAPAASAPLYEEPPPAPPPPSEEFARQAEVAPGFVESPTGGTDLPAMPVIPPGRTNSAPPSAPDPKSYGFPKDTLILHVGDSFAGSLGVPLGKRFKAAGMRTVLEFETPSYIPTWASGKELPQYVEKYRPSLVIITLGANEVELANPEQRTSAVKRLVGKLGGRPCVWVIPPLWKPDTGIFNVIRANAAPCRILESDSIVTNVTRQKDKIHPSDPAREEWADAVLAWLAKERVGTPERPWELRPAP